MRSDSLIQYSVVVPFYNEQENIPPLYMKLTEVMDGIGESYELVFVDDGSKDNTFTAELTWCACGAISGRRRH